MEAIEFTDVVKTFSVNTAKGRKNQITALDNVCLQVNRGEFFTVLGPNGAGKTTTIKILASLLLPDSGKVTMCGIDILKDPYASRKLIGFGVRAERSVYWKLTGRQNLEYFGALYGMHGKTLRKAIDEVVYMVDLEARIDDYVERYSTGMKQGISLAVALLHGPEILLLDEPTTGLDPQIARNIRQLVKKLTTEKGKTVIFTTHILSEAQFFSDRVAILNHGQVVALDTPQNLIGKVAPGMSLEVNLLGVRGTVKSHLMNIPSVQEVLEGALKDDRQVFRLRCADESNTHEVIGCLLKHCDRIESIKKDKASLEDVFIKLLNQGIDNEGNPYELKN